jgi:hypothetical protein
MDDAVHFHPVPKPPKRAKAKRQHNSTLRVPEKRTLKAEAPVKPRNPKRQAKEWARAYGSEARHAFVKSLPCVVCGRGPCDNAHTSGDGGASYKASAKYVIPLCRPHHREQHDVGAGTFAIKYSLDLRALADETERAWRSYQGEG